MPRGGPNSVNWDDPMTEQLLAESSKLENAVVLRGLQHPGQKTSGTKKKTVFTRIASVVLPTLYARNPASAAQKTMSKYYSLTKIYSEKAALLRATGNGVGAEAQAADGTPTGLRQVHHKYYINSDGPTQDTPPEGVNLWEDIVRSFKWFPEMHKLCSMRPNQVPIALTTGIGPSGPETVFHQPPSRESSPDWDLLDKVPSGSRTIPNTSFSDDDDSDSSIIIFPPSSPPPPPGPGKGVDPRERGARPAPVAVKPGHPVKSEKVNSAAGGTSSKAMVEGKKTGPRASNYTATSKSANPPNDRKRKNRDSFMAFAEDFANHRAKVNSDNAYVAEKRLLLTAAGKYHYSKKEFKRRDRRIDIRYGRINISDSESSDEEISPITIPVAQPPRPPTSIRHTPAPSNRPGT
ncbi:hypothetical protein FRC08_015397 [Ceratobasidium sp. 394]|nr:hypothetical protein FRC08_015397 [Ceratobasidium sp. 394]